MFNLYELHCKKNNITSVLCMPKCIPSRSQPISRKLISNGIEGENANKYSKLRSFNYSTEDVVQVRMQNASVTENGATRLIYSVHLGGKPVPAETAARDMALLSSQEVALELGAPVLIQSEPYLKESRPLALSRKRDALLLIGAASAGFIFLIILLVGLICTAKRKRAHSAVAAPPNRSILSEKPDHVLTTGGRDNGVFSTSEIDAKTESSSQSHSPRSMPRSMATPDMVTTDTFNLGIHKVSSDNEEEQKRRAHDLNTNTLEEHYSKQTRLTHERVLRANAVDMPKTSDSMDIIVDHLEALESLETNYERDQKEEEDEATASPHSYLSMPNCKQFPDMKSVEPLSRVLEPVMVRHLDLDSPELERRDNNDIDTYRSNKVNDKLFARTSSAMKDPGVVGPIVWNLRKQTLFTDGNVTSETDEITCTSAGPVGRAKRRLHELLEDSFSLFGSREQNSEMQTCTTQPNSAVYVPDVLPVFSKTRERCIHVSPGSSPTMKTETHHTSLPQNYIEENITENGHSGSVQSHSGWSSRPLSAGPFHRPNVPDIDTKRILLHCQLPPEDPAVPLIASIKRELEKFS